MTRTYLNAYLCHLGACMSSLGWLQIGHHIRITRYLCLRRFCPDPGRLGVDRQQVLADTCALAVQLLNRELYRMKDNKCHHHHTEVDDWLRSTLNYIRTADLDDLQQVLSLALAVNDVT